jgi:thiamine kinase-like enzyme
LPDGILIGELMQPSASLLERVTTLMASAPVEWREMKKGHTAAETWVMRFENGTSAFVKHATDEKTATWLKSEQSVYEFVQQDFLPELVAWDAEEFPILVLEDLSNGRTAPPWNESDVGRVLELLERLAQTKLPEIFRALTDYPEPFNGWREIAKDRLPFLKSGLATPRWLEAALPALVAAETAADLKGDSLVHTDFRSDNIFFHRERMLLIDWNWACKGNPKFDLVSWLPTLHTEGGPPPWAFTLDEPNLIAMQAGYLANRVTNPPADLPESIRTMQQKQLQSALPWAAKALGLPAPENA